MMSPLLDAVRVEHPDEDVIIPRGHIQDLKADIVNSWVVRIALAPSCTGGKGDMAFGRNITHLVDAQFETRAHLNALSTFDLKAASAYIRNLTQEITGIFIQNAHIVRKNLARQFSFFGWHDDLLTKLLSYVSIYHYFPQCKHEMSIKIYF